MLDLKTATRLDKHNKEATVEHANRKAAHERSSESKHGSTPKATFNRTRPNNVTTSSGPLPVLKPKTAVVPRLSAPDWVPKSSASLLLTSSKPDEPQLLTIQFTVGRSLEAQPHEFDTTAKHFVEFKEGGALSVVARNAYPFGAVESYWVGVASHDYLVTYFINTAES